MLELLTDVPIQLFGSITDIQLDWLAKLIGVLIGTVGSVGVGIIIFTLILKTVVLPFDIYQRVSMRKQSLKMEQMRPELEKLQKQYASDPQMYQAKMQEVYKKNGYNMLGACLPMILSLVILIVAFNELNAFSQYSNLHAYKQMAEEYNSSILTYCADADDCTPETLIIDRVEYTKYQGADGKYFIYYLESESGVKEYYIDVEKAYAYDGVKEEIDSIMSEESVEKSDAAALFVKNIGREAAAESFRNTKISFLWVKNIWYSDTMWNHPLGSYSDFTGKINKTIEVTDENGKVSKLSVKDVISESTYNEITANLSDEKSEANGYFILCVLSVGLMLLSQFISMRSQKTQNELSSVNQEGQSTQKMMMFIMPIMYGIFAFTYSGSFSIYMVISSAYSIITMVISNIIVDKMFNKQEEKALQAKYNRVVPTRNSSKKK